MDKRKLDGTEDESSVENIFVNLKQSYISCEKSGTRHLAEPGFTVGRLAD